MMKPQIELAGGNCHEARACPARGEQSKVEESEANPSERRFAQIRSSCGKAHVAKHLGAEKPTQELRSFFARWSIKYSAEYYEAKERQASAVPSPDGSKLRTLR